MQFEITDYKCANVDINVAELQHLSEALSVLIHITNDVPKLQELAKMSHTLECALSQLKERLEWDS